MNEEAKITYILASINDLQASIRSYDTKTGFLLALLFLPATKLGSIYNVIHNSVQQTTGSMECAIWILTIAFIFLWILAVTASFLALLSIENPSKRVRGGIKASYYYPIHLYGVKLWSSIFMKGIKSDSTLDDHHATLPKDAVSATKELTAEQMKIMYIVCAKSQRAKIAYFSCALWVGVGGVIWLISLATAK